MIVSMPQPAEAPARQPATEPAPAEPAVRVTGKGGKFTVKITSATKRELGPRQPSTKTAKILKMLQQPEGASLVELAKATKWQGHSVRGFLSGTVKRKMDLKVTAFKRGDGERAYRIKSK